MNEIEWLDNYSGQSTDELIALEGKYRTDSIVVAFEEAIDQKAAKAGDESLSEQERVVIAVEALEREVNNGGFEQFFYNSSNEFASIVADSLRKIGVPQVAEIAEDAIDALEIEGEPSVENIERRIFQEDEQRSRKLGECDDRYYEIAGDLSEPLFEYIKKNKERIRLPE